MERAFSWLLIHGFSTSFFQNVYFFHRYSAARFTGMIIIWGALMWSMGGDFTNKPKNTMILKNWNAGFNSSVAFSVLCFNASTVSSFDLKNVDAPSKLNIWLVLYETWNSVENFLKFQTALVLVFTETKRIFVVSIILSSFTKWSIDKKQQLALWQQHWRQFWTT